MENTIDLARSWGRCGLQVMCSPHVPPSPSPKGCISLNHSKLLIRSCHAGQ